MKQETKIIFFIISIVSITISMIFYTQETVFSLIVLGIIIKNWEEVKLIFITTAAALLLGSIIFGIINLSYNKFSYISYDGIHPFIHLLSIIYALAIIIEEDCRKPYIWIYSQLKRLNYRKFMHS